MDEFESKLQDRVSIANDESWLARFQANKACNITVRYGSEGLNTDRTAMLISAWKQAEDEGMESLRSIREVIKLLDEAKKENTNAST